jgi:hypothetical protein
MAFAADVLDALSSEREVVIETRSADGRPHRVPIWVVVDGGTVFARSWRGAGARWYEEFLARGGTLQVRERRVAVRAVRATDPESVRRTSDGYRRRFAGSRYLEDMLDASIADTTIRIEPT